VSNPEASGNQPSLTWPNIIGTIGVTLVLAGGMWTLFQQQISSLEKGFDVRFHSLELKENNRYDESRRREEETIREFDRRTADRRLADTALHKRLDGIEAQLLQRNEQFVTQKEFQQAQKAADDRWRTQADINRQAMDAYLTTKAWEAWRGERDKLTNEMNERIRALELRKSAAP
jgi:hypothetical protein